MAFSKVQGGGESSREELTRAIIKEVRGMPGNRECCDCSAPGESQLFAFPSCPSISLLLVLLCSLCPKQWDERQEMGVNLAVLSLQIPPGSPLTWAS